ncbi:hypothetical protein V6Z12_A03G107800 [Gossypium hirsutum]
MKQTSIEVVVGLFQMKGNHVKSRDLIVNIDYELVDCGSTGTRVNIFEWEKGDLISDSLPSLLHSYPDDLTKGPLAKQSCHYHCMQTEPGLHKFVGNASGVRASLEPLIAWAEQRVLDDIEIVVREHSFVYTKNSIRVLTGKEEAYYGWVALNYKMGSLGNSSKASTFGLLDLGGSSLQVVVEVSDKNDNGNVMTSNIGSNHKILAFSLPAFGLNEAFDRTVVMLSQNQTYGRNASNRFELRHPCLSSNFVQNYTCPGCAMLNISVGMENSETQMHKTRFSSTYLIGDLNWEQCKELVRAAAMNYSGSDWSEQFVDRNCEANSSPNGGVSRDLATRSWSARNPVSPRASVTEIWKKGEHDFQRQKYAGYYCFWVSYVASVIEDALCLGNAEIAFGPGDLSWTLGAALVYQLDTREASPSISTIRNLKMSSTVFLLVLLLSLFLVVHCSQIKLPMLGRKVSNVGVPLPSYYLHAKR